MKQSEVETILAKLEASIEASHQAQMELLHAIRRLFREEEAIPQPERVVERDPDVELAALDEAAFDGLPNEAVFTVQEVAKLFRVGKSSIYEAVRQRRLPSVKLGNQIRIPRRALVAFLRGMDADEFGQFVKRKVEERHGA